ncbi:MAG: biopolymer transporter ExbD [Ponticaulis sp.]|nr:biopolymer transporter ExbD [Ponticaulis sp.]|tara:strand:+ start:18650 stop:19051 length:402 start_codon:yes stop_codon:yes gene_type:complete
MKRFKRRSSAEADMTPMLDIVFILLIFFVVTATFLRENALNMTPPPDGPPPPPEKSQSTILVRIDGQGMVRVNDELSDIIGVRARIERLLAEAPDQAVLVQAHPRARNQLVIKAVDQAYSAGVQNVGFALDAS